MCIFSDHNEIYLGFNNKENSRNYTSTWILNSMFLNEDIKREIKKNFLNQIIIKIQCIKN